MTARPRLAYPASLDEIANPLSLRRIRRLRIVAPVPARRLPNGLCAAIRPVNKVSD